jgi:hypothetical protein
MGHSGAGATVSGAATVALAAYATAPHWADSDARKEDGARLFAVAAAVSAAALNF